MDLAFMVLAPGNAFTTGKRQALETFLNTQFAVY
jgi:hypothetical protein